MMSDIDAIGSGSVVPEQSACGQAGWGTTEKLEINPMQSVSSEIATRSGRGPGEGIANFAEQPYAQGMRTTSPGPLT
jgi:hypothetical protein